MWGKTSRCCFQLCPLALVSLLVPYLPCDYKATRKIKASYVEILYTLSFGADRIKQDAYYDLLAFHSSHPLNFNTAWRGLWQNGSTPLLKGSVSKKCWHDLPHSLELIRILLTVMSSFTLLEIEKFCKIGKCSCQIDTAQPFSPHCISKDRRMWIQIPTLPLTKRMTGWMNWVSLYLSFLISQTRVIKSIHLMGLF